MAEPTVSIIGSRTWLNHLPLPNPGTIPQLAAEAGWRSLAMHPQIKRWQQTAEHYQPDWWSEIERVMGSYRRVAVRDTIWRRSLMASPPPLELWQCGNLPPPPYLAVVGPRDCSEYAARLVESLVRQIAPYCTVITGLARGIDSLALQAALAVQGRVIAVVPLGLDDTVRRPSNLVSAVIRSGAVIGERLVVNRPVKTHFLFRNRLLAALADAVFIPEAGERSGTLNTARQALERGVDVMVAPGDLTRLTARGSNQLLSEGANLVTGAADLAAALGLRLDNLSYGTIVPEALHCLRERPQTADEIAAASGLDFAATNLLIRDSLRRGTIRQDWQGRYQLLADVTAL